MSDMSNHPNIRPVGEDDDMRALTDLIHAAYAPHLESGLRYFGSYQTVEDTRKRFEGGSGFVSCIGNRYIATLIIRPPQPDSSVPLYRDEKVRILSQFCVHPEFQGRGIGRKLHDFAIQFALSSGAKILALDTSDQADGLIAMYKNWGYEIAGQCDWRPTTNYTSLIMKKDLI